MTTDLKGEFGGLSVWYLPDGIVNIFSMHKLEKLYRITYNSWEGFYVVHTPQPLTNIKCFDKNKILRRTR